MTRYPDKKWDQLSKDKTNLARLIYAFEVRNRTLNRSPKTTSWYTNNLRLFKEFLEATGRSLSLANVGLEEVREYVVYLQQKKRFQGHPLTPVKDETLSPQTIRAHVESLKGFFTWLHEEGYTNENKLEKLQFPKVPKKYVNVLSETEIRQILAGIDQGSELGTRNLAIVIMLLDTGLRLAELVNLKSDDTYLEQGYLKVMGKGSRERVVPIGATTQRTLLRYIYHFRPEPLNVKTLFLTTNGASLTVNSVRLMLKRLGESTGVPRLHAHLCRHTFATNYLLNGGDLFSLQQILGHSSLEMVRKYVTLLSSQVTAQHRKFSPMDQISMIGNIVHGLKGDGYKRHTSRMLVRSTEISKSDLSQVLRYRS